MMIRKCNIFFYLIFVSIVLFILWLLIRIFIADTFIVPSESMEPTLIPGDVILVDKTIFGARIYKKFEFSKKGNQLQSFRLKGFRKIIPGDVVVFNMPNNGNSIKFIINYVFCKRCIGCPGDIIVNKGNRFVNNNTKYHLPHQDFFNIYSVLNVISSSFFSKLNPSLTHSRKSLYVPRKGDLIQINQETAYLYKLIIEQETGKKVYYDRKRNNVKLGNRILNKYQFKHNYYFMLGDNFYDSYDSRYWGFVPEEYIIGIATRIIFSWDHYLKEIQWKRCLRKIK